MCRIIASQSDLFTLQHFQLCVIWSCFFCWRFSCLTPEGQIWLNNLDLLLKNQQKKTVLILFLSFFVSRRLQFMPILLPLRVGTTCASNLWPPPFCCRNQAKSATLINCRFADGSENLLKPRLFAALSSESMQRLVSLKGTRRSWGLESRLCRATNPSCLGFLSSRMKQSGYFLVVTPGGAKSKLLKYWLWRQICTFLP